MYETVSASLSALRETESRLFAYDHAMGVLYLDATTAAPRDTYESRGRTMAVLNQAIYDLSADPKNEEILSVLEANADQLDAQARRETELFRKSYDQIRKIPAQEYVDYGVLINEAGSIWARAKAEDDFSLFAPYLEKIVAYNRRFAGYYNPDMAPYDALLNEYEEGLSMKTLDEFFACLRRELVPLIAKVKAAEPIDDSFLHTHYPVEEQRKLSDYLMDLLGLDRLHCGIAETEHPYTTGFSNLDVRITTHYYEDNVASSMYSVIHEGGHAAYELGCDSRYNHTLVAGGASMGIHESQSRFFENVIGRSLPFIRCIFPKLRELFPEQLREVDDVKFWRAVNKAEPSLIRTEADELTYCMHIMVRYELEKQLIEGTLQVSDIPEAWNRLYQTYLGISVPSDRDGCLQDSHWSSGSIGYFPSYALGSAYGLQFLHAMEEELGDIWKDVEAGDLSRVKGWLNQHIHRHARLYKPGQLLEMTCGKFDPSYYTDYLKEKYTKLYNLP